MKPTMTSSWGLASQTGMSEQVHGLDRGFSFGGAFTVLSLDRGFWWRLHSAQPRQRVWCGMHSEERQCNSGKTESTLGWLA